IEEREMERREEPKRIGDRMTVKEISKGKKEDRAWRGEGRKRGKEGGREGVAMQTPVKESN
ncbi:MAG: hypothetical protein ACK5HT_21730, partial [Draconibacterium sp.]